MASLAPFGETCEIESNYLFSKVKCITVYYGRLVMSYAEVCRQKKSMDMEMYQQNGSDQKNVSSDQGEMEEEEEEEEEREYDEDDTFLLGVLSLSDLRRLEAEQECVQ